MLHPEVAGGVFTYHQKLVILTITAVFRTNALKINFKNDIQKQEKNLTFVLPYFPLYYEYQLQ